MGQKRGIMVKYGKQEERKHKGTTQKCMVRLIFATINCSMTGLVCANVFGVLLGALATRSTMRSALDYSQKTESLK